MESGSCKEQAERERERWHTSSSTEGGFGAVIKWVYGKQEGENERKNDN